MIRRLREFILKNGNLRRVLGISLIILGIIIHLIPFVPAGWIIVLGLELLGIRVLLQDKIKEKISKIRQKWTK